jgi:hypothetical protein
MDTLVQRKTKKKGVKKEDLYNRRPKEALYNRFHPRITCDCRQDRRTSDTKDNTENVTRLRVGRREHCDTMQK